MQELNLLFRAYEARELPSLSPGRVFLADGRRFVNTQYRIFQRLDFMPRINAVCLLPVNPVRAIACLLQFANYRPRSFAQSPNITSDDVSGKFAHGMRAACVPEP